ncbi:hypothetical protein B0H14DRAFT_2639061 [Mycena olivaceomarginata]|nr:hypothetical protein B0H14DRAFT_2639061 [Mycena olivaceomarginata]
MLFGDEILAGGRPLASEDVGTVQAVRWECRRATAGHGGVDGVQVAVGRAAVGCTRGSSEISEQRVCGLRRGVWAVAGYACNGARGASESVQAAAGELASSGGPEYRRGSERRLGTRNTEVRSIFGGPPSPDRAAVQPLVQWWSRMRAIEGDKGYPPENAETPANRVGRVEQLLFQFLEKVSKPLENTFAMYHGEIDQSFTPSVRGKSEVMSAAAEVAIQWLRPLVINLTTLNRTKLVDTAISAGSGSTSDPGKGGEANWTFHVESVDHQKKLNTTRSKPINSFFTQKPFDSSRYTNTRVDTGAVTPFQMNFASAADKPSMRSWEIPLWGRIRNHYVGREEDFSSGYPLEGENQAKTLINNSSRTWTAGRARHYHAPGNGGGNEGARTCSGIIGDNPKHFWSQ